MLSKFFKSVAAGAGTNIAITRGFNLHVTPPIERQMNVLSFALAGFIYGLLHQNSSAVGFSVGLAVAAVAQSAPHFISNEANASSAYGLRR